MQTTLLIMEAGIGSRFGGGIKQLEPVDDQKHIIMDYSIHDAIEAGFNKVVFIIRRDIEKEFKGDYNAYIDAMYDNSILCNLSILDLFIKKPTVKAIEKDLATQYSRAKIEKLRSLAQELNSTS